MGRGNPARQFSCPCPSLELSAHRWTILPLLTLASVIVGGCGNKAVAETSAASTLASVREGDHVLYGRASKTDPYYWVFAVRKADGTVDTLTYRWDFGDGLVHGGANVGYRYTQNGAKAVVVHGMDGETVRLTMTLDIVVQGPNRAPVANAGSYIIVDEGAPARLDASPSTDADGDALTFEWRQTSGPSVELDDAASATPSFVAPSISVHTLLVFAVRVSDGQASSEDTVGVVVKNTAVTGRCPRFSTRTPPRDRRPRGQRGTRSTRGRRGYRRA